jgi:hypothetical protein
MECHVVLSIKRRTARRRQRRTVAAVFGTTGLLAASAGGGVAAVTGTSIDDLLGGTEDPMFAKAPGAPRSDLELVDDGGLRWATTVYLAESGMIALTSAPDQPAEGLPDVGGGSPWVVADNLRDGPLAGISFNVVNRDGTDHYLLAGTVDARAREVSVEIDDAAGRRAALGSDAISARVESPPARSLTPAGQRLAERMPDEVDLRPFAVSFPPDSLRDTNAVRITIETTLDDGSRHREQTGNLSVH